MRQWLNNCFIFLSFLLEIFLPNSTADSPDVVEPHQPLLHRQQRLRAVDRLSATNDIKLKHKLNFRPTIGYKYTF